MAIRWVHPEARLSALCDGQVFGRDPTCPTVLQGSDVSRRHAAISWRGVVPVLRDLGSRNGLFIGGERVTERPLGPQDVVRIGEWVGVAIELFEEPAAVDGFSELGPGWYGSPRLSRALEPLRAAARTDLPIVLQGETGVGKEGAARALHGWSGRSGPFIAVDCGALPEQLAEAQLFGHRRGAFTGAERAHQGLLRAADRGTLFLDEVLNLPPLIQAKLLRSLEQREVLPLGETTPVPIDVRVTCAAQESLTEAVAAGRFRADLLARLDGLTCVLPPLRERKEDVLALLQVHLQRADCVNPSWDARFAEALLVYDWPLNVREVALLARRLVALRRGDKLDRGLLPERIARGARGRAHDSSRGREPAFAGATPLPQASEGQARAARTPVDDAEQFDALTASLRSHDGNVTRAAAALGMSRARAYRLLSAHPEFERTAAREEKLR